MAIDALKALARLREGNQRFTASVRGETAPTPRPTQLPGDQEPFAVVLGCSDSRVPPEIVFDQGLGDLFVIRVAGNVVTPSLLGSVEFAAMKFGTRLVVVLGHSRCGAVLATLDEVKKPSEDQSPNLRALVDRVRPAVEGLGESALVPAAVRANVRASVEQLRNGSQILNDFIRDDGLVVVGAEYSLETGVVEFFDGDPGA